jgi:hypothetical protein
MSNLGTATPQRHLSAVATPRKSERIIGFINIRAFFFEYYCGIYNVLKLILIDWLIQLKHLGQWSLSKP